MKRSAVVIGAAIILAGGALTLATAASQAAGASSSPPGWRKVATVTKAKGIANFASIAAVTAGDAWASGETATPGGKHAPVVEHWAGRSWQRVRLPAKVVRTWNRSGLDGAAIGASSASNVWVAGGATVRGIRYSHTSKRGWQFGTIPGTAFSSQPLALTIATTIKVISRTDVWVFGLRVSGSSDKVTPYAAQFAAHRWHARTVPGNGAIAAVIVKSPKKMLALVGSDEFLGFGTDTPTVVQWNGRKWTPLPVQPKPLPGAGNATSMAEAGGHIWIGGDYPNQLGEWADFVAELTGSTWKLRELPDSASGDDFQLNSLVPDGRGGLWALGKSYTLGVSQRLWHYNGHLWRAPISPRFGGSASELSQLTAVPGTDSIWGAGVQTRGGSLDGLIAVDGPTPR